MWDPFDLPSHAVHHGVMAQGNWAADYYTSQPARVTESPSDWWLRLMPDLRSCAECLSAKVVLKM